MDIPITLYNDIVAFFLHLPNVHESDGRRALVYQAGIDEQLLHHVKWDTPSAKFFPVLVKLLFQYGKLHDGRYALDTVLETAKGQVGVEHQKRCDTLIQQLAELRDTVDKETTLNIPLVSGKYTTQPQKKFLLAILIILIISLGLFLVFNVAKSFYKETFYDDFEHGLLNWNIQGYSDKYNDRMRWHISSKESLSGNHSLSLGHSDTDIKDNNDDVQITTKTSFIFTEKSILQFSLKKNREINLQVFLISFANQATKTILHFTGGDTFSDWKLVSLDLSQYADNTSYQIMLQAWGQGSLYVDDIQLSNISN